MADNLDMRRQVVTLLKKRGKLTIHEIAAALSLSYEAARQHVKSAENAGWIDKGIDRGNTQSAGRPTASYSVTMKGDHLFAKHYDALTVEMIDTLAEQQGLEAVKELLKALIRKRVRTWEPLLADLTLPQRLDLLKSLYFENDPFMEIEEQNGEYRLVERNCPFLNVAMKRPLLCSVTISTLSSLLGVRVQREQKFQSGDGCCSFRLVKDEVLPETIDVQLILENDTISGNAV